MDETKYDSKTTGRILEYYVFDMEQFNSRIASGQSWQEAYEATRNKSAFVVMPVKKGRHYIYQYEVNGVTYTRASVKVSNRKDIYNELRSRSKHPYAVFYNSANPFISELGNATDTAPTASNDAVMSLIFAIIASVTSPLVVPGIVMGILAIVKAVKAMKGNIESPVMPIMSIIWGGVGLLGSLIAFIVYIVMIFAGIVYY